MDTPLAPVAIPARMTFLNYSKTLRVLRMVFGPACRLYRNDDGTVSAGIEANPGRKTFATAATFDHLIQDLFKAAEGPEQP